LYGGWHGGAGRKRRARRSGPPRLALLRGGERKSLRSGTWSDFSLHTIIDIYSPLQPDPRHLPAARTQARRRAVRAHFSMSQNLPTRAYLMSMRALDSDPVMGRNWHSGGLRRGG
jgi:hypothetical protein